MATLYIEAPYNITSWTKKVKMHNKANIDNTAIIWVTVMFLNFKNIKKLIPFNNVSAIPKKEIFI